MIVHLTYFRNTGDYYNDDVYETRKKVLSEIYNEIREMFRQNKRPGLVNGHDDLHVLINVIAYSQNPYLMLNVA